MVTQPTRRQHRKTMSLHELIFFLLLFAVLVLFSAFFSSAETALLTVSRIKLTHRAKKKDKKAILLARILEKPEEFLSTILIGNNLVNVAAAAIATYLFTQFFKDSQSTQILAATVFTTLVAAGFRRSHPQIVRLPPRRKTVRPVRTSDPVFQLPLFSAGQRPGPAGQFLFQKTQKQVLGQKRAEPGRDQAFPFQRDPAVQVQPGNPQHAHRDHRHLAEGYQGDHDPAHRHRRPQGKQRQPRTEKNHPGKENLQNPDLQGQPRPHHRHRRLAFSAAGHAQRGFQGPGIEEESPSSRSLFPSIRRSTIS